MLWKNAPLSREWSQAVAYWPSLLIINSLKAFVGETFIAVQRRNFPTFSLIKRRALSSDLPLKKFCIFGFFVNHELCITVITQIVFLWATVLFYSLYLIRHSGTLCRSTSEDIRKIIPWKLHNNITNNMWNFVFFFSPT